MERLIAIVAFTLAQAANAADTYVPLQLARGVRIELPRNWTVLSKNQGVTLEAATQANIEKATPLNFQNELGFAANYYNEGGRVDAIVNVRYYPEEPFTQNNVEEATLPQIVELDKALERGMRAGAQPAGINIAEWRGTRRQSINGVQALVTEYRRNALRDPGFFRVRLVRVFDGSSTFTLTVSYRESEEYLMRPICDRIISKLRTHVKS